MKKITVRSLLRLTKISARAGLAAALVAGASACAATGANQNAANHDAGKHMSGGHESSQKMMHGPHIIKTVSNQDFAATLASLQAAIDKRGFKTFAVIDHAKGAASVDQPLPPTTLIIFGSPKGGTPLMQSARTIAIDLPLKALVYEDADEIVMIAVPDVAHLIDEHGIEGRDDLASRIAGALAAISAEAAGG